MRTLYKNFMTAYDSVKTKSSVLKRPDNIQKFIDVREYLTSLIDQVHTIIVFDINESKWYYNQDAIKK